MMSAPLPMLLWGVAIALRYTSARHPSFKGRLSEKELIARLTDRIVDGRRLIGMNHAR